MSFCAISMKLDQAQLETNLIVIQFLMEHGANPNLKCESTKQDCFALSESHVASERVQEVMANTAQKYFHNVAPDPRDEYKKELDCTIDEEPVAVSCCNFFSFCKFF